jgi:hypothetical protein
MFSEPLAGKRKVSIRKCRTKTDWAFEVEELIRVHYRKAEKIM